MKTNVLFFTRGKTDKDNTQQVWVYDLRANMPQFGRRTQLLREHFSDFEIAFGDDPWGSLESLTTRVDKSEQGRFRCFSRAWIAKRGDSLDISWLKDDSETGDTYLAEPAALAREAMRELEASLEELRGILTELGEDIEE